MIQLRRKFCKHYHSPARNPCGQTWKCPPLNRYRQLWSQLKGVDRIVYRIALPTLLETLLRFQCWHSYFANRPCRVPMTYQVWTKHCTGEAYWMNMAGDVERYCWQCTQCQQCKVSAPIRAPLTSVPIGKADDMLWTFWKSQCPSTTTGTCDIRLFHQMGRNNPTSRSKGTLNHHSTCQPVLQIWNPGHCAFWSRLKLRKPLVETDSWSFWDNQNQSHVWSSSRGWYGRMV